jgi:peroxiredoxin
MRHRILALEQRAFLPYAGMVVPAVQATTLAGDTVTIGDPPAESRQVLLFFTTTCGFCRQTLPAWQRIADTLRATREAEIISISLDSALAPADSLLRIGFTFPVIELADPRLRSLYRAKSVPLTLVIGDGGRVLHARLGALTTQNAVDSVLQAVRTTPRVDSDPLFVSTGTPVP